MGTERQRVMSSEKTLRVAVYGTCGASDRFLVQFHQFATEVERESFLHGARVIRILQGGDCARALKWPEDEEKEFLPFHVNDAYRVRVADIKNNAYPLARSQDEEYRNQAMDDAWEDLLGRAIRMIYLGIYKAIDAGDYELVNAQLPIKPTLMQYPIELQIAYLAASVEASDKLPDRAELFDDVAGNCRYLYGSDVMLDALKDKDSEPFTRLRIEEEKNRPLIEEARKILKQYERD